MRWMAQEKTIVDCKLQIDTAELDCAIEKVKQLIALEEEAESGLQRIRNFLEPAEKMSVEDISRKIQEHFREAVLRK